MRLKSYFAATVEGAMASARQELGADAMLVTSRKAPAEARHLGEYEVVFATVQEQPAADSREAPSSSPDKPAPWHELTGEVSQLRRQVEQMASGIGRAVSLAGAVAASPELSQLMSAFMESGINAAVAHRILEGVQQRRSAGDPDDLPNHLKAEIGSMLNLDASVGRPGQATRIVTLIGPSGAGKTTTLVKLAITEGLRARRRTHFVSMDVERVGGAEQLRSYAAILGTGFQIVDSPAGLARMISELDNRDLILIDTPGFGAFDLDAATEIAHVLNAQPGIDIHLVLPASMRAADLARVCQRFAIFEPAKLLFTRTDEAQANGAILSAAVNTGKPVSYLCGGQRIPEDIEPATVRSIMEITLPTQFLPDARQLHLSELRQTGAAA
jgi:flagellar biosynthesis protein FlhF